MLNSTKSTNRKDTILTAGIRNFLILFIDGGGKNAKEVFENLEESEENFENIFLHKFKEDTKTKRAYHLNIDLEDLKIYYSKEFFNENQQITRDIFEIELTNIGKETLKRNFTMINDECSKCNSSRDKNLIKLGIPFCIADGRTSLVQKRNSALNNNNLIDSKKLCGMIGKFLPNIRNNLYANNEKMNDISISGIKNEHTLPKKRKFYDVEYENVSDDDLPKQTMKYKSCDFSETVQWI